MMFFFSLFFPYLPGSKRCYFDLLVVLCLEIRRSRAR